MFATSAASMSLTDGTSSGIVRAELDASTFQGVDLMRPCGKPRRSLILRRVMPTTMDRVCVDLGTFGTYFILR